MSDDAEILAIHLAHRAGQARLGVLAGTLALIEWSGVDAARAAATGAQWTAQAIRYISGSRRKSYRLAVAYYRYIRALETGYTVPVPAGRPQEGGSKAVTKGLKLGDLRKEYEDILLEIATLDTEASAWGAGNVDEEWFEEELRHYAKDLPDPGALDEAIQDLMDAVDDSSTPAGKAIKVDDDFEFTPSVLQGDALENRYEALLGTLVTDYHDARLKNMPDDLEGKEALAWVDEQHASSGSLAANAVSKAAMEPGRDLVETSYKKDSRVKAVARVTKPGCCAFCAMLAGRGYVYVSEASADFEPHGGCNCTTAVTFLDNPVPLPLNVQFGQMWQDVQKGKVQVSDPYIVAAAPTKDANGRKLKKSPTRNPAYRAWRRYYESQNPEVRLRKGSAPTPN